MKIQTVVLILVLTVSLSGCSTGGGLTLEEIANADYGRFPNNHQDVVKSYFSNSLKDPFSARYQFTSAPARAYSRNAPAVGGGINRFGYVVNVSVNAKNSYGAYVGWKNYRLLIRNDRVIQEIVPNPWFDEPWYR
jgi:hypothetical protein